MPIVLDDNILIPPSQRRGPPPRVYYNVSRDLTRDGGATTTTIIDSRHSEVEEIAHVPRIQRSPVIIHQETTSYIPPIELNDRHSELLSYDRHGGHRRYYAGSEPGRSRHRSISIGSEAYGPVELYQGHHRRYHDEYDYHHEDGKGYNYVAAPESYEHRHRHRHRSHSRHRDERHRDERLREERLREERLRGERQAEAEAHDRKMRHFAQAGLAVGATAGAIGAAKVIHDRRERRRSIAGYSSDSDTNDHTGRKLAGAALGATAAGIAAHKYRQHRHRRSLSRSSDSYYRSSDSDTDNHTGRKLAGAALGATAAGIAAHKYREHRRKSRSMSRHSRPGSSRSSSSDREGHRHRKAKIAAGTAAAIGTGLAARHMMRNRSRSRSSSRSPSPRQESHKGRHVAAAVLGATAAGVAHHKYKNHQEEKMAAARPRPVLRRSASEGSFYHQPRRNSLFGRRRSPSPHKTGKLKKGMATVAAAAIAKKAMDHYRQGRSPSPHGHHHRQRSRSRSGGVPKKAIAAMAGAAIAGERIHRKHKEKQRLEEKHRAEEERYHHMNGSGAQVPGGPNHPF